MRYVVGIVLALAAFGIWLNGSCDPIPVGPEEVVFPCGESGGGALSGAMSEAFGLLIVGVATFIFFAFLIVSYFSKKTNSN